MHKDVAYKLAEYATSVRLENLPPSAVEFTKKDIYDSLATGIVGSSALGVKEMLSFAEEVGGAPQATVFVFGNKLPAHVAAAINTVMIHGYDYDDTHDVAMMHCGAIVISSALAAAEKQGGVSGADFLAAVTVGLDIHCRLGLATTIGIVESGWVYTSLLGVFGAVAAVGRIIGLTADEMVNAFGIAYAQAAGNYQAITDSAWTKRIQPGFASQAAIVACMLAQKGVQGAKNVFEGRYGLFHVYLHDRYDPAPLVDGLGEKFMHEDLAFKPWPCARPNQPPINVCLEARERFDLDPNKVKHVEIRMNEHLYICSCIPDEIRKKPSTIVEGQFSIPYSCACALVNGRVGLADYTQTGISRPDVLAMAAKIDGVIDAEIEKNHRAKVCPVVAKIEMDDGSIFEHRLDVTLGCKEKPMTDVDVMEKMQDCIAFCALEMPENTAENIKALVNRLDTLENSNEIAAAMRAII